MAKRRIIWTPTANQERIEILKYWAQHNQSKTYSRKLNRLFLQVLQQVSIFPQMGKPTVFGNSRVIIIRDYQVFYMYNDNELIVLAIWDSRRDTNSLRMS